MDENKIGIWIVVIKKKKKTRKENKKDCVAENVIVYWNYYWIWNRIWIGNNYNWNVIGIGYSLAVLI